MKKKKVFRSRISVFFIVLILIIFIQISIPIFQQGTYQDLYLHGGVLLFPLSSPAVSLKRLCIGFANERSWLISPVREEEFIEELKAVNPDISVNVPSKKGIWRIQDWDV